MTISRRIPRPLAVALAALVVLAAGLAIARAESRERMRERMPFGPPPVLAEGDTNRDGTLDAAEWSALFATLDADHDGKLEGKELHFHPEPPPEALAFMLAHHADADDDGKVTASEWKARVTDLDADHDGALAGEELAFRHHFDEAIAALPPFAAIWDTNGDGKLQSSELDALFAKADADSNGVLDEMRERHRFGH
jgi:Ca2+-binding EF-hand superfamily protein